LWSRRLSSADRGYARTVQWTSTLRDLDSFDFLNVLIALHERLGVEVPEKDYADVQTLNGMLHYFGHRCCEEDQGHGSGAHA
jgi:hypothetical protein